VIEIRFPTPEKEKLGLLNQYAEQELLEAINWGNFVYIEIPKYKLGKFKKFVTENRIAKREQIEEVQSIDLPVSPPEDIILLIRFFREHEVDFSVIPFIKLPTKYYDALMRFCDENNIWDEPPQSHSSL
jgi:hypothetical protein